MIRLRLPENGKKAQCDCLASTTYSVICNFGKNYLDVFALFWGFQYKTQSNYKIEGEIAISTRIGRYQNLSIYFCVSETADDAYKSFKTQLVHFSILQICRKPLDLFQALINKVPIFGMFASDQIHNPMRIDAVDQLPESITYGFLVRTCTRLNDHIFIAAELTIDHLIPKSYVYKYSYHTKENEQRKFPVYGSPPTDPQSKSILIVEKSCGYGDALTTLPLLQKFTDIYIQRGMRVEILHYYRQSYELSSVFLGRCQNQK